MAVTAALLSACLFALLLVCDCGNRSRRQCRRRNDPNASSGRLNWNELPSVIKVGMTQAEVKKPAGEPQFVHSVVGVTTWVRWEYSLPSRKRFLVHFDSKGKVEETGLDGVKKATP